MERVFGEMLRFGVVGATNTVIDLGIYIALTRSSAFWAGHIVLAAAASFIVATIWSFLLNNFWTFRRDANALHRRGAKFFLVAAGGLGWNALILSALTAVHVHDILAKLAATAVVVCWNFALQKRWTFKA